MTLLTDASGPVPLDPGPVLKTLQACTTVPLSPNRGGYTLTMRECQGAEEALAALEREPRASPHDRRLHVGWGSFRNLDVAAARRSDIVLLLDINQHQFEVWAAVRQALSQALHAPDFIERLVPALPQPPRAPRLRQFADSSPAGTRHWLRGDLGRPGSWLDLAAPERFAHVRDLFAAGAVGTACVDLRSHIGCQALGQALLATRQREALQLDTVYVSNIPWMLAQPIGFFGEPHSAAGNVGAASVLDQVHANLSLIVAPAHSVISAMKLRPDATPDNLQWSTELTDPARFLSDPAWHRMQLHAKSGPAPDRS
jgi:hypothetical protein